MKHKLFLFAALLCLSGAAAANNVLQKSDKLEPRWVKHTPKAENLNIAYRVVQVYVDDLSEAPQKSLKELANYVPQEWGVQTGTAAEMQVSGYDGEELLVRVGSLNGNAQQLPMRCRLIDTYWELVQMGFRNQYRCYVLYQVKRPGASQYAEEYVRVTDRYGFGPVALSIIPGAGQMYKGSYLKGGLIMGGSVLCAGGIVLCEANKASYQALANKEHNATKRTTYQNNANNWGTGSYVCIGALAALWIYNIIDAGVAPGSRHTVVDKDQRRDVSFRLEPTTMDPYTPSLTARITF